MNYNDFSHFTLIKKCYYYCEINNFLYFVILEKKYKV